MLCRRISVKVHHRVITTLLLGLLGLISAFSIQMLSGERAIGTQREATQLSCSSTSTLNAADFSKWGRTSYNQGDFAAAIDCWQKAVAAYGQSGNETEKINNQINLAQAEEALGLYPRAYKTLVQIYKFDQKLDELKCTTFPLKQECRDEFSKTLEQANSPFQIAGLHSLGNVLLGLGELELSEKVLLLSLQKEQRQAQAAIRLDLGNTKRALSAKQQDLYNRSEERSDIEHAREKAKDALETYEEVEKDLSDSPSSSQSITYIQAKLNQLSFLLALDNWFSNIQERREDGPLLLKIQELREIREQRTQLQIEERLARLRSELPQLQSQIEKLPPSHTTLYIRLNFAQSLMRLDDEKVEPFLKVTVEQAKAQRNTKAESYALGYLGQHYESSKQQELAKTLTRKALLLAQSPLEPEILYQWQWQLGQIYKHELPKERQVQINNMQQDALQQARLAYKGAFQTLESLRQELATGSPDAQFSFQEDIERIYREYVDLLLRDEKPNTKDLLTAREVIASLQAVELENYLRQSCPEYNLEKIDEIVDLEAKTTVFLYPIVLDDRVEVILKLPTDRNKKALSEAAFEKGLEHYRKDNLPQKEVERQIRKLQIDLEEAYTFDDVRREAKGVYEWLVKGAEKYLEQYQKQGKGKIDTLVFALDTTLRNIPLAALVYDDTPSKPQYLIEKYAIALAPRLDIPNPQPLAGKTLKILAAGRSKAGRSKAGPTEAEKEFPELRYVDEELEALKNLEGIGDAKVSVTSFRDEKFNIKNFGQQVVTSDFQIVHLATHGQFSSSPENTFILASAEEEENTVEEIKVNELDRLFRVRTQQQSEAIELLVLSACETAAGDRRSTLGISGVGVRAGARSAIASLWTLDDRVSVEFTKEFYKQLIVKKQPSKAKALQEAQKTLMNEREYEHPRYWAPYILLGNWL